MAIETTTAKTLIEVKADTTQAQKAIRDLAETTAKGNAELKRQAEQSGLVSKKWEELGKSMVGLQINDTFKRISDSAKEATGGVLDLNGAFAGFQAAGPYGAAIGAVGVAVAKTANLMDGMGIEMDELEKKAQAHARQYLPELTGEIWKQHDAIKAMNDRLAETPGALARAFTELSKIYPILKKAREEIQAYDSLPAQINRGLGAAGGFLQNGIASVTTRGLGISSWGGLKYKTGSSGPESDTARRRRLRGMLGEQYTDWTDIGGGSTSLGQRASENVDEFGIQRSPLDGMASQQLADRLTDKWQRTLNPSWSDNGSGVGAGIRKSQESFLAKTFGPIDEFNLYAQGFQMLTGAVGASLSAWIDGSMSAGQAFKKFIGEALKGLAVQMSIEALKHGAYALGSLAFGDVRGAGQHAVAAAEFGLGAAAAAIAAKEFGGGAKPASTGGRAPNVAGGGGGGSREPDRIIVYGDAFAEDSPRGRQRQAKRMVARALGNNSIREDA